MCGECRGGSEKEWMLIGYKEWEMGQSSGAAEGMKVVESWCECEQESWAQQHKSLLLLDSGILPTVARLQSPPN